MKISAVYKITNTVTGDFYIGSSKDVKHRQMIHKCPSRWKKYSNNPMYLDMQKYGVDKFEFQILEEVESEHLKEKEQKFIEKLKPTYNQMNAKGFDIDRYKEYMKEYMKSETIKEYKNKYNNQPCSYNGETLTLNALAARFQRTGIKHYISEAKKYLLSNL